MSSIYLFDVDGTLTPAKSKIDDAFAKEFLSWMSNKEVYIVSGGSFVRLIDQLGLDIIDKVCGVFACMGNIFYQKRDQINPHRVSEWDIIYENNFVAPRNLHRSLNSYVAKSDYHTKTGKHYEVRVGMMNFSIVGRNADKEQRLQYEQYDLETGERKRITDRLRKKYPELEFVIGGAVSIDIFNKGNDKSQIIDRYFKESLTGNQIHFVGDRIPYPGNDNALAVRLQSSENGHTYEVDSWEDTSKLLKTEAFA